jgi:DNA polymerase I-like protein with 3'-5' exonuclease and polymerase domains
MVEINRWIEKNNYDDYVHMLVNIHDALLFQIHIEYQHLIPEIGRIFTDVQGAPFNLKVPFAEEHHIGSDWAEASYG